MTRHMHVAEYAYHRQCNEEDARSWPRHETVTPEQPQPDRGTWWLDCGDDVPFDEPPSAAEGE